MKSLQLAVVLCLALAHCSLHSSLNSYLAKLRATHVEPLRTRSIQKREDPQPCYTYTCLNPGQKCQTNPFNNPACNDCALNLGTCIGTFAVNQTAPCPCFKEAEACMRNVGGFCLSALTAVTSTCTPYAAQCNCTIPIPAKIVYTQCQAEFECLNNTVCTRKPTLGQPCVPEESECTDAALPVFGGAFECSSDTSRCVRSPDSVKIGDVCNATTECVGAMTVPQGSSCTGGICVGVPANGVCMDTDECAFGLYCKNSQCVPQIAAGGACSVVDKSPCVPNYVCGAEATCIASFSKALGANCVAVNSSVDRGMEEECTPGTFCSPITNKCRAPYQMNACNPALNNTDCEAGTECFCAQNGDYKCMSTDSTAFGGFPATCKAAYLAAGDCMAKAKCKGDFPSTGGCAEKFCKNQINCLLSCYLPAVFPLLVPAGCGTAPTFPCIPPVPTSAPTSAGASGENSSASTATLAAASLFAVLLVA